MKTVTVVKKSVAMAMLKNYPNCRIMMYDNGKYSWTGSAKHYIGREVEVADNIKAVWVERRQDSYGPYARAMCITE